MERFSGDFHVFLQQIVVICYVNTMTNDEWHSTLATYEKQSYHYQTVPSSNVNDASKMQFNSVWDVQCVWTITNSSAFRNFYSIFFPAHKEWQPQNKENQWYQLYSRKNCVANPNIQTSSPTKLRDRLQVPLLQMRRMALLIKILRRQSASLFETYRPRHLWMQNRNFPFRRKCANRSIKKIRLQICARSGRPSLSKQIVPSFLSVNIL